MTPVKSDFKKESSTDMPFIENEFISRSVRKSQFETSKIRRMEEREVRSV